MSRSSEQWKFCRQVTSQTSWCSGKVVDGVGGARRAMHLVSNPDKTKVIAVMEHCVHDGTPKILKECGLPSTGARAVSLLVRARAVRSPAYLAQSRRRTTPNASLLASTPYVTTSPLRRTSYSQQPQKGSVLAFPDDLNAEGKGDLYIVEGIGYDFIPDVLSRDPSVIDSWIKTDDQESFEAVRKLMRMEGLLVGGSSGSALSGALRWLKSDEGKLIAQTKGANVVVLLADG